MTTYRVGLFSDDGEVTDPTIQEFLPDFMGDFMTFIEHLII
ncbi:hypothetical protein ABZ618_01725 [Streptomyces roseolus]